MTVARWVLSLFCVLFLAGCTPLGMSVPTYTLDPGLLQTLEAIRASTTRESAVTQTPTIGGEETPLGRQTTAAFGLTPASTLEPSEITSRTPTASKSPRPSKTPRPSATPRPSKTPTRMGPTATAAPQDAPIRIYSPASFSRLISPVTLVMSVIPGSGGNIYLQVTGENLEVLYERKWILPYSAGHRTTINEEFEFSIPVLSEAARIQVYTLDEYGRFNSLATEDVVLLSVGQNDLAEADNLLDPFALLRPYPDQIIKHGNLVINGMTRCRIDCRLYIEVVDMDGNRLSAVEQQNILQASLVYQPIYYEIPVKVTRTTNARVILHQQDLFTREDIAISSVLVQITP